jgi:hypothetical protein
LLGIIDPADVADKIVLIKIERKAGYRRFGYEHVKDTADNTPHPTELLLRKNSSFKSRKLEQVLKSKGEWIYKTNTTFIKC